MPEGLRVTANKPVILPEFIHKPGEHCVTSALGAGLRTVGVDQPEEMLFGLAQGLGGAYFDFKANLPFLGGRSGGRNGEFSQIACSALHVHAEVKSTLSPRRLHEWAQNELSQNRAAVVYVDMAYLPYNKFPTGQHFGGHVVAIVGYAEETKCYTVADRYPDLAILTEEDFFKARASKYPPFPAIGTQVFLSPPTGTLDDLPQAIQKAIAANMQTYLNPPIRNVGVSATAKFASEIQGWEKKFDRKKLVASLHNIYIYIEEGGTGGAAFRKIYSRFLSMAAEVTGDKRYKTAADALAEVAIVWTAMAKLCFKESQIVSDGHNMENAETIASMALHICKAEDAALRPLLEFS